MSRIIGFLISVSVLVIFNGCQDKSLKYKCTPCDLPCDEIFYNHPGVCPHCKMKLIPTTDLRSEDTREVNDVNINNGSGAFLVEGGFDKSRTIDVHYYKPTNWTPTSDIVILLPGAGRNGRDYRNAWIESSEEYGILVLALEYNEQHYPGLWNYNLGGMISNVDFESHSFTFNSNATQWIYKDFDRIFHLVKKELVMTTDSYDMFGHSAGGQILHRMILFDTPKYVDQIIAANSGWYTLPSIHEAFPYGLNNSNVNLRDIQYDSQLVIFLGEQDNASETRGHLRHTPEADRQGLHRLSRGQYFFECGKAQAMKDKKAFLWKLEVVLGVGHDYRAMSNEAARYLYSKYLPNT